MLAHKLSDYLNVFIEMDVKCRCNKFNRMILYQENKAYYLSTGGLITWEQIHKDCIHCDKHNAYKYGKA